jgi:acyl carrier protein
LGRGDDQIKIRGFRIELGEIEAVLAQQPQVREAVVQLREDVPGDKRLIAYLVAREDSLSAADLRAFAKQLLPEYMLPAAFVLLPALPRTPNGKVDRSALPAPAYESNEPEHAPPRTPMERALAKAMAEVLNLDRVGLNDNFFDLGGHSLLAVQLINRIRHDLNIDPSLRQLFETPTVSGLALAALENPAMGASDRPIQTGGRPAITTLDPSTPSKLE